MPITNFPFGKSHSSDRTFVRFILIDGNYDLKVFRVISLYKNLTLSKNIDEISRDKNIGKTRIIEFGFTIASF